MVLLCLSVPRGTSISCSFAVGLGCCIEFLLSAAWLLVLYFCSLVNKISYSSNIYIYIYTHTHTKEVFNHEIFWGNMQNPYLKSGGTCGSSSGSAISVAANLVSVSLGTETNGSIICPADHNSVVGLNPLLVSPAVPVSSQSLPVRTQLGKLICCTLIYIYIYIIKKKEVKN